MIAPRGPAVAGLASRTAVRLLSGALVGFLCGCASYLEVRSLATARPDLAAYELTGGDPAALRQEAMKLCPQGGAILREAAQAQRPQGAEGSWARWIDRSGEWLEPPRRSAQLVVLCQGSTPAGRLSAEAPVAPVAAASVNVVEAPPALPIGPTSVEW